MDERVELFVRALAKALAPHIDKFAPQARDQFIKEFAKDLKTEFQKLRKEYQTAEGPPSYIR